MLALNNSNVEEENARLEIIVQLPSMDDLPDECLVEILRRIPCRRDRSASAFVSHRWLYLLVSFRRNLIIKPEVEDDDDDDDEEEENYGDQERYLVGNRVTNVRLASVAVGAAGRGGLGKLDLTGNHPTRGATDFGLSAVAHCCPCLHLLSISHVSSISDFGVSEIARCCPLLDTLCIIACPFITDKGLIAVAENCPDLTSLIVESCTGIGYDGIRRIAELCPLLHSVSIKNCQSVGDRGIAGLMWLASSTLSTLKLEGLNITDLALACIGFYGKALTELCLTGLFNVAERGFWAMGKGLGLLKLRSIFVTACPGLTNVSLREVANGCPALKRLSLRMCYYLSDGGLLAFAEAVPELEHLLLQECHCVSLVGVLGLVMTCKRKIRTLCLMKCMGIREIVDYRQFFPPCTSLHTLVIRDCSNLTRAGLAAVGRICSNLLNLELSGLVGVTDVGLLPFVESSRSGMVRVTLSGCLNLTDSAISTAVKLHGETLRELHLGGCDKLTNRTLFAIADNCSKLVELDMSGADITNYGVALLASARRLSLRYLALGGCSKLTEESLPLLANMGPAMEVLILLHCGSIGAEDLEDLEEKMWWCHILS